MHISSRPPTPPVRASRDATNMKVLSLNDWLDGAGGIDGVIGLIKQSGADVVGLQESSKNTAVIAEALGYHYVQQQETTAVVSRFPITGTTPQKHGVTLQTPAGPVDFFNVHLYYHPYQPYQLLDIPYGEAPFLKTEEEAVAAAREARGKDVQAALAEVEGVKSQGHPIVVTGDFNEPSYLDWTQQAADAGRHPLKVEWPSTKAFAQAGFADSYRTLFPDEMAHPGETWTPTTSPEDPKDHHDRIDFVLYQGPGITPQKVEIVGENAHNADIVVSPYPTDHRGVMTTFALS